MLTRKIIYFFFHFIHGTIYRVDIQISPSKNYKSIIHISALENNQGNIKAIMLKIFIFIYIILLFYHQKGVKMYRKIFKNYITVKNISLILFTLQKMNWVKIMVNLLKRFIFE